MDQSSWQTAPERVGAYRLLRQLGGDIYVGPTGVVEADVEAENVVIQGEINGNVTARKQLQIQSAGKLLGNCTSQSIDIKEGAQFEGRSKMNR